MEKFKVQSVIFLKKHYTLSEAKRWLKKNNYRLTFDGKSVDITDKYFRFRQARPKKGVEYITKSVKKGVKIILMQ